MPPVQCKSKVKNKRRSVIDRGVLSDSIKTPRQRVTGKHIRKQVHSEPRTKSGCDTLTNSPNKCDDSLSENYDTVILEDRINVIADLNEDNRSGISSSSSTKLSLGATVNIKESANRSAGKKKHPRKLVTVSDILCKIDELETNEAVGASMKTKKKRGRKSFKSVSGDVTLSEYSEFQDNSTSVSGELIIPTKKRRRTKRIGENSIDDIQTQIICKTQHSDSQTDANSTNEQEYSCAVHFMSYQVLAKNTGELEDLHADLLDPILPNRKFIKKESIKTECKSASVIKSRTRRKQKTRKISDDIAIDNYTLEPGLRDKRQLSDDTISSAEIIRKYPRRRHNVVDYSTISESSSSSDEHILVSPSIALADSASQQEESSKLKETGNQTFRQTKTVPAAKKKIYLSQKRGTPKKKRVRQQLKINQQDSDELLQNNEEDVCASLLNRFSTIYKCSFSPKVVIEKLLPNINAKRDTEPSVCKQQNDKEHEFIIVKCETVSCENTYKSSDNGNMSPVFIRMRSSDDVVVDMTRYHTDGSIKLDITPSSTSSCGYQDSPIGESHIIQRRFETSSSSSNSAQLQITANAGLVEKCDTLISESTAEPLNSSTKNSEEILDTLLSETALENSDISDKIVLNSVTPPALNLVCSIEHANLNCTISPITPKSDDSHPSEKYRIGFNNSATRYVPNTYEGITKLINKTENNNRIPRDCKVSLETCARAQKLLDPCSTDELLAEKKIKSRDEKNMQIKSKSEVILDDQVQLTVPKDIDDKSRKSLVKKSDSQEKVHSHYTKKKSESKLKRKISLNTDDQFPQANEYLSVLDISQIANKSEKALAGNVKSQLGTHTTHNKKNSQLKRKISLNRDDQSPATNESPAIEDLTQIERKEEKSLSENIKSHKEKHPSSSGKKIQPPKKCRSSLEKDKQPIKSQESFENEEKTKNGISLINNVQVAKFREPMRVENNRKLTDDEEKSLLENIKSHDLSIVHLADKNSKSSRQINLDRNQVIDSQCVVEGISRILTTNVKQNEQVPISRDIFEIPGIIKLHDETEKSLKNVKSQNGTYISPPGKVIQPKSKINVDKHKDEHSTSKLTDKNVKTKDMFAESTDRMFLVPTIPPRKKQRITYNEPTTSGLAKNVIKLEDKEIVSATLTDKNKDFAKLVDMAKVSTKLTDKDKVSVKLTDKHKESAQLSENELHTRPERRESSNSSEGSDDEYYSRNKHSFKFTDKVNTTTNAPPPSKKIKLKRPMISDVPDTCVARQQHNSKPKLPIDCDIISIYADTIGTDCVSERAFDFDEDDDDNKSLHNFIANPNDIVTEWLKVNATLNIDNTTELNTHTAIEQKSVADKVQHCDTDHMSRPSQVNLPPNDQSVKLIDYEKNAKVYPKNQNNVRQVSTMVATQKPPNETQQSEILFQYMCVYVKQHGVCRKKTACGYQHTLPVAWEITLKNMPKQTLLNLYDSVKKDRYLFLFKKIFSIVAMQLGIQRDFNSVVCLVKDVLEINMDSDRTPFINDIINALSTFGLMFHSTVEVIFNSAYVNMHLKDLLTDILINITVERGDFVKNWSAMQLLVKHCNYNVDNGIIQAILMECVKESTLQKELCLKVYNDLISLISDDKLENIFKSLLRDYIDCMKKLGLPNEATKLYDRCVALSLLLHEKSYTPSVSTSSGNSVHSVRNVSEVSPMRKKSIIDPLLSNIVKNVSASSFKSTQLSSSSSSATSIPSAQTNASVPFRRPVVNKVPPWNNKHTNLLLKDVRVVKPEHNASTSAYVAPYTEKRQRFSMAEVKQAIYAEDLSKLMSLIMKYKEGDMTDQFLQTCLDTMQESAHNFSILFNNLCRSVAVIQNGQEDKSLEYIFKTIGTNLIIYSTGKEKWDQAYMIYQTLCCQYKESEILNVKILIDDKPSYIKRLLIICRIFVMKGDYRHAWHLFKENGLHTKSSWVEVPDEHDVEYRNTVFVELLEMLVNGKQWPAAFNIAQYVLTNDITELYSFLDNVIHAAINNECHLEYITSLMSVCPHWYYQLHKYTFRIILIKVIKCSVPKMAENLYRIGCELNIYPNLYGHERAIEFSTHFVFEEVQLMLNVMLDNMLICMPITNSVTIEVKQSSEVVEGTVTEFGGLLYQNHITCNTMLVRIVNILNNYIKPPIRVINKNNKLEITPQQLANHLNVRSRTSDFY